MQRGCGLILVFSAVLIQAQTEIARPQAAGEVSIPAELMTTVRAERAQRGDPVEFRTLEAELVANGVVMPANTKLTGRIVGAAPQQGDKPSWLVLLVERAEWKQNSIALHAFIARQIAISSENQQNPQASDTMTNTNPRRAGRESARVAANDGIDVTLSSKLPQDAKTARDLDARGSAPPIKDLRIVRDKDGIAYLFSSKSNVKLPSGTLFVLQNQALQSQSAPGPSGSSAGDSRTVPAAPQQWFMTQR